MNRAATTRKTKGGPWQPAAGAADAARDPRAGFTLLEVSAALSLLAILALTLAVSVTGSAQASTTCRERASARVAAQEQLERALAWPDFASLAATFDGTVFAVAGLDGLDGPGSPAGAIAVDATRPDLLAVTVAVDWVGLRGSEHLELRCLIAEVTP